MLSPTYCTPERSSWPTLPVLIAHQLWGGHSGIWPGNSSDLLRHAPLSLGGGVCVCLRVVLLTSSWWLITSMVLSRSGLTVLLAFCHHQYPIVRGFNKPTWLTCKHLLSLVAFNLFLSFLPFSFASSGSTCFWKSPSPLDCADHKFDCAVF